MAKTGAGLLLGLLIALPVAGQEPATEPKLSEEETKQILAAFRDDLQSVETEVLSKALSLSTEEATKFWPVFQKFQTEQKAIIDGQIAAVRKYATDYANLKGEDALAYVSALLERDQRIHDLRVKYLAEYSKVLPAGKAARAIHLTRRLGLASQAKLATEIPLVH
jgi:hypothetical protein